MRKQGILIVPLSNASSVREQGILKLPLSNASTCPCQTPVLCEGARHSDSAPVLMPVLCDGARHPEGAPFKCQFCMREQGILIVPL
ncbi:hypothetical protein J6590_093133 [Homalodisca vitripennis]|nr:hypothetical protein J6590_093133 [Homalodisca vitripennis]